MATQEEWVVWNGSLGMLDTVAIAKIVEGATGRTAFLAPPYDVVGPFDFDELEAEGCTAYGACLVMSRERWRVEQERLRREAWEKRRALMMQAEFGDDEEFREILGLPLEGSLEPSEINAAFRRQAKTAHPDTGGSSEAYRRISDARDALLLRFEYAS
jgi:hypothetical protein